jgi:hypothetical protein
MLKQVQHDEKSMLITNPMIRKRPEIRALAFLTIPSFAVHPGEIHHRADTKPKYEWKPEDIFSARFDSVGVETV